MDIKEIKNEINEFIKKGKENLDSEYYDSEYEKELESKYEILIKNIENMPKFKGITKEELIDEIDSVKENSINLNNSKLDLENAGYYGGDSEDEINEAMERESEYRDQVANGNYHLKISLDSLESMVEEIEPLKNKRRPKI